MTGYTKCTIIDCLTLDTAIHVYVADIDTDKWYTATCKMGNGYVFFFLTQHVFMC